MDHDETALPPHRGRFLASWPGIVLGSVAIFSLGIVTSGYLLGDGLRRAKAAERAVTVRGVSERDVIANTATWSIGFSQQGPTLAATQPQVARQAQAVRKFFLEAGFKPTEISDTGISVSRERDYNSSVEHIIINRRIGVKSNDIARMKAAFAKQAELVAAGVPLTDSNISYTFTQLDKVKPAMVAEATRDARESAQQFAKDSGAKVGGIKSATQGYFSIEARDGESDYGSGDTPNKKVRVVTTVEFYLD